MKRLPVYEEFMEVALYNMLQVVPGSNVRGWGIIPGRKIKDLPTEHGVASFEIKTGLYRVTDVDKSYVVIESPKHSYLITHVTARDIKTAYELYASK